MRPMHAAGQIAMAVRERDRRNRGDPGWLSAPVGAVNGRSRQPPASPVARTGLRRGAEQARLDIELVARRDFGAVSAP